MPYGQPDDIEYAVYEPVSVICQLGSDDAGHYIVFYLDGNNIVCISDSEIRVARGEDLEKGRF